MKTGILLPFGQQHQLSGRLTDLADAAGRRFKSRCPDRLDRVNHHGHRLQGGGLGQDRLQRIFGKDQQVFAGDPQAFTPQTGLRSRLLSGYIQNLTAGSRQGVHRLQQQRGFADTRVPADQNQ